ncbi:hypothetical protein OROGR_019461 [Orobanche gracilis]
MQTCQSDATKHVEHANDKVHKLVNPSKQRADGSSKSKQRPASTKVAKLQLGGP